jgi:hypothetical protein
LALLSGHEAITTLGHLEFHWPWPASKQRSVHSNKQAMVPKVALKSSLAMIGEWQQRRMFGREGLSIGHLCKFPISLSSFSSFSLSQT